MNKSIANPTTCYSDSTLAAVAIVGIAEAYLGNLAQGQKHLIALRLLTERHGGSTILQDMLFGQAILITLSYVGFGAGDATFQDELRLKNAIGFFTRTFQALQSWYQRLRVEFEEFRGSDGSSSKVHTPTDALPPLSHIFSSTSAGDLQRYRSSRRKVFGVREDICPS
jgi:hypothetical protein